MTTRLLNQFFLAHMWWVPGSSGRAPGVPETPTDGLGGAPEPRGPGQETQTPILVAEPFYAAQTKNVWWTTTPVPTLSQHRACRTMCGHLFVSCCFLTLCMQPYRKRGHPVTTIDDNTLQFPSQPQLQHRVGNREELPLLLGPDSVVGACSPRCSGYRYWRPRTRPRTWGGEAR